jgi:hypothetical protein
MKTFFTFEVNYFENDIFDFVTSVPADTFSQALTEVYGKSMQKSEGKFSITLMKVYVG